MQFEFIARKNNGGYNDGDPPLPIPNREVKPISADDTAIPSGKVGSRQLIETFSQKWLEVFFCAVLHLAPSYPATLLTCHLLTLPSLLRCTLLTMLSFWCPLIISTAELPSFVGSVHLTSVACSSGSPDKSDHRQTWNVDKNWSPTNSVGRKIYLLWNSQTPPTLFRKHSERGWPLLWNNFASQTPATPSRGLSKAYRRLLWITRRQNFFCQRGKWIALSMDFVTTILPINFKFWLRSQ